MVGSVWPLPQKIQYGAQNRTIQRDGISFAYHGLRDIDCDILKFSTKTYLKKWFFPTHTISQRGGALNVIIRTKKKCPRINQFPQQNMSEEYFLKVPPNGDATIEAEQVWGVLRALETLSQLIFKSRGSYFIRTVTIYDWPEYPIRGVLIDTSRHYVRKNVILRQIDLLAQNKMNLLHWHIVDMESFPFSSKTFPNLSSSGAFTTKHIYTGNTVTEIIQYGRLRGVRVMVEFDTPGHMSSWFGQPGLLADCHDPEGLQMPPALIDPTEEKNYDFLKTFFTEVLQKFPEEMIHLGGDEVSYWVNECWKNNAKIDRFMKDHGIENTTLLTDYYYSRLLAIIEEIFEEKQLTDAGRFVFWDEAYRYNKVNNKSIVHIWTPKNESERKAFTAEVTSKGQNVILSSCWYLNNIIYGNDWLHGDDLHSYYYCDPRAFNGTEEQKKLVLGGIAAMWGEYVDGTNLESRLWPRASAVAERLWSSPVATKDGNAAWPRLHEQRCRLVGRGYRAQPVNGPESCPLEYEDELP